MFVAFCAALLLEFAGRSAGAQLVDPILVGLVVILTLSVPVRMALRDLFVHVVRPGRTLYAMIHVLLDEAGSSLEVREADRLRRAIVAAVVAEHGPVIVDVVFTGIEAYAAPTTGFRE